MAAIALNGEERIGLALSVAAHAGLLAFLVLRPETGDVVLPPERIEVTLSDEVGLTSTSPDPFEGAAGQVAPQLGEEAPAQAAAEQPLQAVEAPAPVPAPVSRSAPAPAPAPRATSRPAPRQTSAPAPQRTSTPAPAPTRSVRTGGSRIGSDFLEGAASADASGSSSSARAAEIGPRVRSALAGQISRELKPHWSAPQGADAEDLVTILAWNLNRDGSLDGSPRLVRQLGVNDVNRAQAPRHVEQAIRAVQLAAPFDLPAEYYDGWKRVSGFRFDKRLSQ